MSASATESSYRSAVAVERAVDLLFALAERGEASVSELARELGVAPSGVHRILTALKRKGLVEQTEGERYELAWRLLALTRSLQERADLRALALPHMTALRDLTGETITLNVRSGFERACIEQVEGVHEVRWSSEIGRVSPLYAGVTGKVLLAHLPPDELERYLETVPRPRLTHRTTVDRTELERELARIRERGYAAGGQDRIVGVAGASAPIFDRTGAARAALTIAGPAERCTRARLERWNPALLAATREITSLLG